MTLGVALFLCAGTAAQPAQPDALPKAMALAVPGAHVIVSLAPNVCAFPAEDFARVEQVNKGSHVLLIAGNCSDIVELTKRGTSTPRHSIQVNVLDRDFEAATRVDEKNFLAECKAALAPGEGQRWLDEAASDVNRVDPRLSMRQQRYNGILEVSNDAVYGGTIEYLKRDAVEIWNIQVTVCFVAGSVPLEWLFQAPVDPHDGKLAIEQTLHKLQSEAHVRVKATKDLSK